LDLAALEGDGEPLGCLSQFSVAKGPQSLLLTSVRQPFLDCGAGAAECAIDRGHGGTQRLCRLLRGEAQHVAQDKC
jgi:hypothetical protein